MTLMKESFILIVICTLDLVLTVFLLGSHHAFEGNPLMAYYLQFGLGTFILVKIALFAFPIFVAEWCKQYRPRFVRSMLRLTILAYVGAYVALFLTINVPTMAATIGSP